MKIIALANRKGGVGKTTTAINLAAGLAIAGKGQVKVLLIDMDSQANATLALSGKRNPTKNVYQFLSDKTVQAEEVIIPTAQDGLELMPSHEDLAGAEVDFIKAVDGRERLRYCLEEKISTAYDYVIIDSPPSLGFLTINTLSAATDVIIPIAPGLFSIQGIAKLQDTVEEVRNYLRRPQLKIAGILRNFYEKTIVARDTSALLKEHFGQTLFQTVIPKNVKIEEAHSRHTSIFTYDCTSTGAQAYARFVEEVKARV